LSLKSFLQFLWVDENPLKNHNNFIWAFGPKVTRRVTYVWFYNQFETFALCNVYIHIISKNCFIIQTDCFKTFLLLLFQVFRRADRKGRNFQRSFHISIKINNNIFVELKLKRKINGFSRLLTQCTVPQNFKLCPMR